MYDVRRYMIFLQSNFTSRVMGDGQVSDVTGSAGVTGRYLAKAIISDKSK